MTIIEAINEVDDLKPNPYSQVTKIKWLSNLDGLIKRNILDTHELDVYFPFPGYDEQTDLNTGLLVGPPYDSIYLRWLEAQIDLANGEYDKYNASITVFSDEYRTFENDYNRNHRPLSNGPRFRF